MLTRGPRGRPSCEVTSTTVLFSRKSPETLGAFDLRVRRAAGAEAPLRPWVGDGVKWAKSAVRAHWASRRMKIEHNHALLRVWRAKLGKGM